MDLNEMTPKVGTTVLYHTLTGELVPAVVTATFNGERPVCLNIMRPPHVDEEPILSTNLSIKDTITYHPGFARGQWRFVTA